MSANVAVLSAFVLGQFLTLLGIIYYERNRDPRR